MALDIGIYGARGVPSTYSGYETFLSTLLPELAQRGHAVTMYCRTGEGIADGPWRGVQRRVLPAVPGKNTSTLTHGLVAAVAARRAGHDVVLAVNVANAAYTAIGRLTNQPTVLNTDGQEWRRGKWGTAARTVFHRSAQIAGRCATGLVADCRAMHDVYRDDFGAGSTIIPYCAPTIDWEPSTAVLDELGIAPEKFMVIAGRLNPENNIDRVADAIAASDLDLPLVVLGAANYESPVTGRLDELARRDERIRVVGHVGSRQAFFDLLHHAAVYLHGHSVGGINPSIVEAMSVGARVVAFDTEFNREVLGADPDVFVLDPPDVADVVGAVLAEDASTQQAARDRAAARIASLYPVDAVVDAYEAVLQEAAGQGRRRGLVVDTAW